MIVNDILMKYDGWDAIELTRSITVMFNAASILMISILNAESEWRGEE